MYRTFTSSSGTVVHLLPRCLDAADEEADARLELDGRTLERRQGLLVAPRLTRRVRDAPVDEVWRSGERGADLADAIAEADHAVEAKVGDLADRLRAPRGDVDATVEHDAHGIGMERLGVAARAEGTDRAIG